MKRCLNCKKEYPDHLKFCPDCGNPLSEINKQQGLFCPKCGTKNQQGARFCASCGNNLEKRSQAVADSNRISLQKNTGGPVNQNRPVSPSGGPANQNRPVPPTGGPVNQNRPVPPTGGPVNQRNSVNSSGKSKMPVFIGIGAFCFIALLIGIVGIFLLRKPGTDSEMVAKEATSDKGISLQESDEKTTEEPEPEKTAEPEPESEPAGESVDTYQKYYDGLDARFANYIMGNTTATKVDTYSNMLKDALTQKDASMCKTVKENLDKMEKQLKDSSRKKIASTKKQLSSLEKKSSSKKVKKSASYKKIKKSAQKYEKGGKFVKAQTQYTKCIDKLKKAKKNSSKTKSNESTEYYKPVYTDDTTYFNLSNYDLSKSEVAAMDSEQIRYCINTIFAYAGYRFTKDYIQEFFEYQSWYDGGFTNDQQDIIDLFNDPDGFKGTPLAHNYNLLKNSR